MYRTLIIDVVTHTGGLQTIMAERQPNWTRLDWKLQVADMAWLSGQ